MLKRRYVTCWDERGLEYKALLFQEGNKCWQYFYFTQGKRANKKILLEGAICKTFTQTNILVLRCKDIYCNEVYPTRLAPAHPALCTFKR